MTGLKSWQDAFFWLQVPEDFPVRRHHFICPRPHMEHLPLVLLTKDESVAYNYFEGVDYQYTTEDGRKNIVTKRSIWLPCSKYILGNLSLSAMLLW